MVIEGICSGFAACVHEYQPLITGLAAVLVATATALVVFWSAWLPVKAQRKREKEIDARRLRLRCVELSTDLSLIAKRARNNQGTIKVHKAANSDVTDRTKEKMYLSVPEATQDWEFMSLLPDDVAEECVRLNAKLEDHNFNIRRAGGAFGDDNFGRIMSEEAKAIDRRATNLANTLQGIKDSQTAV